MADYANALIKLKLKPQYKNAIETILKRKKRNQSKYFEWYDYFSFITREGEIKTSNPYGENEYLYLEGMGLNINMVGKYSIDDTIKLEDDILTIKMYKKWSSLQFALHTFQENLEELALEVYFCEISAYDQEDEKYYLYSYDVNIIGPENDYPFVEMNLKDKHLITDDEY